MLAVLAAYIRLRAWMPPGSAAENLAPAVAVAAILGQARP